MSALRRFVALALLPLAAATHAAGLDYQLKPRQLAPGVYVIEGAVEDFAPSNGCNIINTGFLVTDAGVVVINTGPSRLYGEQQRAAIAGVTDRPVVRVLNLNLHPDYFFGNQAYADVEVAALAGSIQGMKAEGGAYAANLYRLCGDWMSGTESTPARQAITPGTLTVGGRTLDLIRLEGHTGDDLVLVDRASGVMFAGGLAFYNRVPTTPHARIGAWLRSLDALEKERFRILVPSHGPVSDGARAIVQTRDYLRWLDRMLSEAAESGMDMNEVLQEALPERFQKFGAVESEYLRNVTHLYPGYEQRVFLRAQ
jgi:quinoprotein relay system zinc metallohydrolase 1